MNQTVAQPVKASGGLGTFGRYLSIWVALCMVAGVVLGKLMPAAIAGLRGIEFGKGSQINAPIAVLIWLMITPMMIGRPLRFEEIPPEAARREMVNMMPASIADMLIDAWQDVEYRGLPRSGNQRQLRPQLQHCRAGAKKGYSSQKEFSLL